MFFEESAFLILSLLSPSGATLADLEESIALVASGAVLPVLDCTLPLARFQEGLDTIKQGRSIGKVVCLPCGDDSDSDESFRWGAASSPL